MKKIMEILISFFGCFFAIYWLPFARMNFSIDAFTNTILNPVDFLLGGISFMVGFIYHAKLFEKLANLKKYSQVNRQSTILTIIGYFIPLSLILFSIKVTISFFIFSTIYGIISLSSPIDRERKKQEEKGEL